MAINEEKSSMPGKAIQLTLISTIMILGCLFLPTLQAQDGDGSERLDLQTSPIYDLVTLSPGFTDPHTIRIDTQSTQVDLFRLTGDIHNWSECAGYTSTAPTLKINWESTVDTYTLSLLFVSDSTHDDTTLFVHIIDRDNSDDFSNWCKDDMVRRLDPMIETPPLANNTQLYIWLGSYYPGEAVSGTFYIFQSPDDVPLAAPSPTPQFGSIWSNTVWLGGLLIEEYCRDVTPRYPDARPLHNEDLSWGCWVGDSSIEVDLTDVCEWQYGPGSYAVQTGNTFLTYDCFRQESGSVSQQPVEPLSLPTKTDYASVRGFFTGQQATIHTTSGQPLPVYRDPGEENTRFAQLPSGVAVVLLAGPVFADGTIWWEVGTATNNMQGWVTAFTEEQIMLVAVP